MLINLEYEVSYIKQNGERLRAGCLAQLLIFPRYLSELFSEEDM
jgi:hypothetical protein